MTTSANLGAAQKAPSSLEEGVGGGGVSGETLKERAVGMRNNLIIPEMRLYRRHYRAGGLDTLHKLSRLVVKKVRDGRFDS